MRALIEEMTAGPGGVATGVVPWLAEAGERKPAPAVQSLPVQRAAPGAPVVTPAAATRGSKPGGELAAGHLRRMLG
ncbi:hypothetical protein [Flindersiella endophytica]